MAIGREITVYVMTEDVLDQFAPRLQAVLDVLLERCISSSNTPYWSWRGLGIEIGLWDNPVYSCHAPFEVKWVDYRLEVTVSIYRRFEQVEWHRQMQTSLAKYLGRSISAHLGLTVSVVDDDGTLIELIPAAGSRQTDGSY